MKICTLRFNIFPEKKTLLDIIADNNYERLESISRDKFNVFPQDFSIIIDSNLS